MNKKGIRKVGILVHSLTVVGLLVFVSFAFAQQQEWQKHSNGNDIYYNDGNVGIGTNAPNATLDVRGTAVFNEDAGDNDFRIESQGEDDVFFINAETSAIGIHTSDLDTLGREALKIKTADDPSTIYPLRNRDASYSLIKLESSYTGTATSPTYNAATPGTAGVMMRSKSGASSFEWHFKSNGTGPREGAFEVMAPSAGIGGPNKAPIVFEYPTNYGSNYTAFYVDKDAQVGLGTSNPNYKLQISNGGEANALSIWGTGETPSTWPTIELRHASQDTPRYYIKWGRDTGTADEGLMIQSRNASDIKFHLNAGPNSANEVLRLRASDNNMVFAKDDTGIILGADEDVKITYDSGNNALNIDLTGGSTLLVTGDGHITGSLTVDGNIAAKYQDLAEYVKTSEMLTPGTVVMIDPDGINQVLPSDKAYNTLVAGVVSEKPGIILGQEGEDMAVIAHTGRVKVKVDTSYGEINTGDLLVTSPVKGYAMKSTPIDIGGTKIHRPGTIIGKALEPLAKGQQGEILTLITLQ